MDRVAIESDTNLVTAAVQGDVDAFEQLVRRHQGAARNLAALLAGPADADDIAQEAFLRAYRSLAGFTTGSPFRPWLLRIVVNQASNHRRSRRRREIRNASFISRNPETPVGPADAADSSDDRRRIAKALALLPDNDRQVLAVRYLLDCSERETAHVLGWRIGTVKSRASRAIDKLRTLMVDESEEDRR